MTNLYDGAGNTNYLHRAAMNIETFFLYNRGSKYLEIFLNNDVRALTLNELKKVRTTFSVTGSDCVYKISNNLVERVA